MSSTAEVCAYYYVFWRIRLHQSVLYQKRKTTYPQLRCIPELLTAQSIFLLYRNQSYSHRCLTIDRSTNTSKYTEVYYRDDQQILLNKSCGYTHSELTKRFRLRCNWFRAYVGLLIQSVKRKHLLGRALSANKICQRTRNRKYSFANQTQEFFKINPANFAAHFRCSTKANFSCTHRPKTERFLQATRRRNWQIASSSFVGRTG